MPSEAKHDIDVKTQTLLTNAYQKAADYLKKHEKDLHLLAEALVEYETLSAEEINMAIKGESKQIATRRAEQRQADAVKSPPRLPKEAKKEREAAGKPKKKTAPVAEVSSNTASDGVE